MSSDNPGWRGRVTSEQGEYAGDSLAQADIFGDRRIQFPVWNMIRQLQVVGLLLVALAGCSAGLSVQSRYTGMLAGCDGNLAATLTRIGNEFAFAPETGALVIRGTVAADGSLTGQLDTQPPGKPPYMLSVTGHAAKDAVTLTYVTPRCTAQGRLTLRPATLLP